MIVVLENENPLESIASWREMDEKMVQKGCLLA